MMTTRIDTMICYRHAQAKGFTLVEMAIVIVIIGVLLGGVLKGTEILKSSRIQAIYTEYKNLSAAVIAYQGRYRAIPGDDSGATNRFAGATAGGTITNGGGNGIITSSGSCIASANATTESCQALLHLRAAGLISGSGTEGLTHPLGGEIYLGQTFSTATSGANGTGNAQITGNQPWAIYVTNLNNEAMRILESQYDDGNAATGKIRGIGNYMTGAPEDTSSTVVAFLI
jgi:prepilin-type N-terminal cleavage/methylation domain-containing protein